MERITVEQLETDFDEYFSKIEAGESFIIIEADGKDMAVMIPYEGNEVIADILEQEKK